MSYKPPKKRNVNAITGYDLSCDENGHTNKPLYSKNKKVETHHYPSSFSYRVNHMALREFLYNIETNTPAYSINDD